MQKLLTQSELASLLGVHARTVRRLKPPSIAVGRAIRYDPERVRAWLETREVTAIVRPYQTKWV